jgi:hypothetical protein
MSKSNIAADSASSATKSFFGGITGTIGVVVGCIIVISILCGGCIFFTAIVGNSNEDSEPTKVGEASSSGEGEQETTSEAETFKIGDVVEVEDVQLEVKAFEDDVVSDNQFIQPGTGMKFVAVDVLITYVGSGSEYVNGYDFSLSDEESYSYDYSWYDLKSPELESKTLNKDMSVRGWLTFEVSNNSKNFTLAYEPGFWTNNIIEVELF